MIQQLKNHLLQNFVKVPDEWLSACTEFIKSEHGINETGDFSWMKDKVYEQWLYSDLTTLGTFSLPFSLAKQKLSKISGPFTLQINHIQDVGSPAYNQLQKLNKDDVENSKVSAEKIHAAAWEPKPSRMLLLQLTDGTSVVQGMEYRPINSLSLAMKPGIKILLKGPIEVRRGVLLLTKNHVTVLGGQVDTLLIPNAPENILRKALRLEETETPIQVTASLALDTTVADTELTQYYNTQTTQNVPTGTNRPSQDVRALNSGGSSILASNPNDFPDDFDDFLDPELEMALIEAEQKASALVSSQSGREKPQNVARQKLFPQRPLTASSPRLHLYPSQSKPDSRTSWNFPRGRFTASGKSFSHPVVDPSPPRSSVFLEDQEPSWDDDDELLLLAAAEIPDPPPPFESPLDPKREIPKLSDFARPVLQPRVTPEASDVFRSNYKLPSVPISTEEVVRVNPERRVPNQICGLGESRPPQSVPTPQEPSSKQRRLDDFAFEKRSNRAVRVIDLKGDLAPSGGNEVRKRIEGCPPYQYICYIDLHPLEKVTYIILGFVTTLLSKLEQNDSKWHLSAKLNDGTGSCDVDFDDVVLREMIGMTVEEFKVKKEEAILNPQLKTSVGQRTSGEVLGPSIVMKQVMWPVFTEQWRHLMTNLQCISTFRLLMFPLVLKTKDSPPPP